jgi:hypothetical protein
MILKGFKNILRLYYYISSSLMFGDDMAIILQYKIINNK